jgi:very-short-patch-repair endonuclease
VANAVARKLRRNVTRQEGKLWLHLRELKKLGFHFRRQVPIKDFIVDFACYNPKVILELDGDQHSRLRNRLGDAKRDAILGAHGFKLVRVWNSDVDGNLEGVFEQILHALRGG